MAKTKADMVAVKILLPPAVLREIDELVRKGLFASRNEAIRFALREFLKKRS